MSEYVCPRCRWLVDVPVIPANQTVRCPHCAEAFMALPEVAPLPPIGPQGPRNPERTVQPPPPPRSQAGASSQPESARKACPLCGESIAATAIVCRFCGASLVTPGLETGLRFGARRAEDTWPPLATWLLVSAIADVVVGLFWLSFIVTFPLAIACGILAFFEFRLYSGLDEMDRHAAARKVNDLTPWQIVVGLINTPTLVCGIVLMILSQKAMRQARRPPL